jgi:hypothetical protein
MTACELDGGVVVVQVSAAAAEQGAQLQPQPQPQPQPWMLAPAAPAGAGGRGDLLQGCYPLPLTHGAFLFPAQLLQQCLGGSSSSSSPLPWRLDVLLDLTVDGQLLLSGDGRAEVVQALVQRGALEAGCPQWRQLAAACGGCSDGGGGGSGDRALFCLVGLCGALGGCVRPRVVRYEMLRAGGPGGGGQLAHVGAWVETGG